MARRTSVPAARAAPESSRAEVGAYLASKHHPLEDDIHAVRAMVLGVDGAIREHVKWSSVSFRNEHDFFATVNLRSTESVQLVFHTGVKKKATAETGVRVDDPRRLVAKWLAKDRCLVDLGRGPSLAANKRAFAALVRAWIAFVGPA